MPAQFRSVEASPSSTFEAGGSLARNQDPRGLANLLLCSLPRPHGYRREQRYTLIIRDRTNNRRSTGFQEDTRFWIWWTRLQWSVRGFGRLPVSDKLAASAALR